MENTFENFITELKEMFDSKDDFYCVQEDVDGIKNTIYSQLALKLSSNACEYLITSNGNVNYDNKKILEDNGFKIYPGEKDSFGWLTGIIERNNRKLIFG